MATDRGIVATHLLTALISHEYQHDQWISEVRAGDLGHALPSDPGSEYVRRVDGYLVVDVLQPEGETRL
ncbi:hypothetical protein SSP24_56960 [Streptomyces spinoverrucosus]|uniref:Uncharacterized protein n=1 Tax=Streptomyces spinoverrucosus TaxID=284043 RepID=A0A4Y3VQL9_9ACTN|nr:hypothetical protein [Streptomyces spinoverrucosus]GEC08041.1 hypothetical protein SSP24_56960 [Streptomyces spinoverrucosus]GHB89000.1 hypothetical protein GCM10010397_71230 [Streptomyces spinoverrucosus]